MSLSREDKLGYKIDSIRKSIIKYIENNEGCYTSDIINNIAPDNPELVYLILQQLKEKGKLRNEIISEDL